jgi:hypothetical protein
MSKCIFCGNDVTFFDYDERTIPRKVKCEICGIEWDYTEHKDNQNWAIRHIRLLEQENANLKTKLENLIQQLEIALGTDLDGSN